MTTEQVQIQVASPQTMTITVPEEIASIRDAWVKSKHAELETAETALAELRKTGTHGKIKRVESRVTFLRKCVRALDAGFVPMPRFDGALLNLEVEQLPLKALIRVNEVTAQKLFDEIRFVAGQTATRGNSWSARRNARDPLIVGVARTPRICLIQNEWQEQNSHDHVRHLHEEWEEHFLIAWWRPEDERPEDLF